MPDAPALPADVRIAFIGGGNMARALVGGLIARGLQAGRIVVAEPVEALRAGLAADFGVRTVDSNGDAIEDADCVVLAVKPQVMRAVCEGIRDSWPDRAVAVSIAAGIRLQQLDAWLGGGRRVVRCMPNTPALLGHGASGLCANAACAPADRQLAESLLAAVGTSAWIGDEVLMDVVTALSGSGPAYLFLLAEAMAEAATTHGMPAATARALTTQTLLGAAHMLASGDEDAATLRARVTSPGGTTQAAVEAFEAGGFRSLVAGAIAAATRRGAELSAGAGS